ncbi:MAG: type II toxin-antitoxin system VapC family toxin [Blastocatellia bacterium]
MTSVENALLGVDKLAFDTAPLIYFVERHPNYLGLMKDILERVDRGEPCAFSSVITLVEVLTRPKQTGDTAIEDQYRDILLHGKNFTLLTIDAATAEAAAGLRARFGIRTPDALQIAAAIQAGCEAFLTNDSALERVSDIRILLLSKLVL